MARWKWGWLGCGVLAACGHRSAPIIGDAVGDVAAITVDASAAKQLQKFTFEKAHNPSLAADVTARITGNTIVADLPDGTDPSALIATWMTSGSTVSIGTTTQVSGATSNDFRRTVAYTVTAADHSTAVYHVMAALPAHGFANAMTFAGQRPVYVDIGDLDGDSVPDVASAELNGRDAALLVNNATLGATTPSFGSGGALDTVTGQPGGAVAIADFDGDGRLDVALADSSYHVQVWLNTTTATGTPTFGKPASFEVGFASGQLIATDVDGDGRPDLAVISGSAATVSVLLDTTMPGDLMASFTSNVTFGTGQYPASLVGADFDGDGRPDLAIANYQDATISILIDTTQMPATTPSYAPKVDIMPTTDPMFVAAADINSDGKPDLIEIDNGRLLAGVMINTTSAPGQTPTFASEVTFATDQCPIAVATPDIDADGRPDVVVVDNCTDRVSIFLNTTIAGADTPTFQTKVDLATGPVPVEVGYGDLNGDDRVDLVVAASGNGTDPGGVSVLLAN